MSEIDRALAAVEKLVVLEEFVEGPVMDVLKTAQQRDEQAAMVELLELNPFDAKFTKLADLQNALAKIQENVMLSRRVSAYFADAILNGQEAEEYLITQQEED